MKLRTALNLKRVSVAFGMSAVVGAAGLIWAAEAHRHPHMVTVAALDVAAAPGLDPCDGDDCDIADRAVDTFQNTASGLAPPPRPATDGRALPNRNGSLASQEATTPNSKDHPGKVLEHSNGLVGPVPEPQTWALLLVGVAGVGGSMRLRRREASAA